MSIGRSERLVPPNLPTATTGEEPPTDAPAPIAAPPGVIHCCVCLNQRKERLPATTIVKGYAVCDDHIELVGHTGFSIFKLGPGQQRT